MDHDHRSHVDATQDRVSESEPQSEWVSGLPPMVPGFRHQIEESFTKLDSADRFILAGGGVLFGFCLGVSCTCVLFGAGKQDASVGFALGVALIVTCNLLSGFLLLQSSKLVRSHTEGLHEVLMEFRQQSQV